MNEKRHIIEASKGIKPRLIILSDIDGFVKCEWIEKYISLLSDSFTIQLYDCRELGGVEFLNNSKDSIHKQFIDNGFDKAVSKLIELETGIIYVLAFSIGGTIAWKSMLLGLKVNKMIAISSTRLRFENEKPLSNIKLYFGENDLYKPSIDWFERLNVDFEFVKKSEHEVYKEMILFDRNVDIIKDAFCLDKNDSIKI